MELLEAAEKGDVVRVEQLLSRGVNVDVINSLGNTPLMCAARSGHLDVVRSLVKRGAVADESNMFGETSLMQAASGGHLDVVHYLVKSGATVDVYDDCGETPLIWAAEDGHLNVVCFLVEHGADVNISDDDLWTPLMRASREGHLDVVRFLVEHGATVDASGNYGRTPLFMAVRGNHLDVVRYLAELGASVDVHDYEGEAPLMQASYGGHSNIARFLVEHGSTVDARDNCGETPLMWAARRGHLDVVRFLVEHGANSNLMSKIGNTAYSRGTKFGHLEVVQFLLPLVRYHDQRFLIDHVGELVTRPSNIPPSWLIPSFEVEVQPLDNAGHIGGDFRGKWLDADVVVKLFVLEATSENFLDEACSWYHLRHPNILKLYGVCNSYHHLFVCEYASNGSLPEYLKLCDAEHRTPWKHLCEAALGLEYLHERKIVHGSLCGSNILIGSDGLAKLTGFRLNASSLERREYASGSLVRWAAPEILRGKLDSLASDVYSLGMCIIEAVSGKVPYDTQSGFSVTYKLTYTNSDSIITKDQLSPSTDEQWELVNAMCLNDPRKRLQLPAVVNKLELLAEMEFANLTQHAAQPIPEPIVNFDTFDSGKTSSLWNKVRDLIVHDEQSFFHQIYHELEMIYDALKAESHSWSTLQRFHDLLSECQLALDTMSQQNRVYRLSATRARDHSIQGLHRRITQLLQLVRPQDQDAETRETEWNRLCREQVEMFVSEASEACVMLSSIDSEEDRSALVAVLRAELRNSDEKYTDKQLAILQKTQDDIMSKSLEDVHLVTAPEWFIPWFELEMNESQTLGEGGFGSAIKAKWLDSEVVVKKLEIDSKDAANDDKKREMRQMFEREVDIWFGLSHPHVVRLFGACHVGRPFFVCELAPNGTLVEYLRHHPDELWSKLREAALGVQYLHARGIVHGDLKGNNIMVGSDGKAKVTDFGLSGVFGDDSTDVMVSGAWHWVAPECLLGEKPSFASDIYSLGMCIIEALRVTNGDEYALPWGNLPNAAVKFHATKRKQLPSRPQNCSDKAWTLIERMCKSAPTDRMLIMTVVDELEKLADRHGDLVGETDQITSDIGKMQLSSSSVANALAEMKNWIANCDTRSDYEGGVLKNIYRLLWDRLEQVLTQVFPGGEDTIAAETTTSEVIALVERSKQRTHVALGSTGVIPLTKFTEITLGGYALHRRLDKFMAAHGVAKDTSSLHDWTSACSTFIEVGNIPTPSGSDDDGSVPMDNTDRILGASQLI